MEKPYFTVKPNGNRKCFFSEILSPLPRVSASNLVYMFVVSLYLLCEWHAEARGGGGGGESTAVERLKWVGYLHPFYLKNKPKSLFLENDCTILASVVSTSI